MTPDCSIIIPFHNPDADELRRAVMSVASQNSDKVSFEIIGVDDGSQPAKARAAAAVFNGAAPAAVMVKHAGNSGLAAARNTGIEHASGKYVIFLDADDWLHETALEKLNSYLDRHPANLTYTLTTLEHSGAAAGAIATGDAAIQRAFDTSARPTGTPQTMPELALAMSAWAHVYDRNFLRSTGLKFDAEQRRWEDRPFIVAAQLAAGEVGFCPVKLHGYFIGRSTGGSITRRRFDRQDIRHMSRHLRLVERRISATPGLDTSPYAAQHFWQSVSRFYTVICTALWPIWFSDIRARRMAIGTAEYMIQRRGHLTQAAGTLAPPHPVLALSRAPKLARSYLIWSLNIGRNPIKLANLWMISGVISVLRQLRVRR